MTNVQSNLPSQTQPASSCYILVIDLGSGGPKVGVVSDRGEIMSSTFIPITTQILDGGGAESDPHEWWDCTLKAAKEAIDISGVPAGDIVAVSCDTHYSVVVAVDKNGEPLMNAISWFDSRGGPYNQKLRRGVINIEGYGITKLYKWVSRTGIAPMPSGIDTLGHIQYIKNEHPDIYEKTAVFLEPMDYMTMKLTGKVTGTHESMLMMMSIDFRKPDLLEYDDDLIKLNGVDKNKFPKLIHPDSVVGNLLPEVADQLGLSPSTQVLPGLNDTNASLIGSGAINDFEGFIYIGTSLLMGSLLPFKKTDIFSAISTMPSPYHGRYSLIAEQGTGGKTLEFFINNLVFPDDEFKTGEMPDDVYERVSQMAAKVPAGSDGVMFFPWLNGTIAPDENGDARGAIFNLSLKSTRNHLSRALMEGIAFNSRWTRKPVEKMIGKKFDKFRFAGGGALSELWAQIHADILGVPIHQISEPRNNTIRGAAFVALNRLGIRSVDEIPDLVKTEKIYEPIPENQVVYDKMFEQYKNFYRQNKKIFSILNGK